MSARSFSVLAIMLIVAAGCGSPGIRGGKKYTRFAPDAPQMIEPARHSGEHFIVVRMAHTKGLARWPDTKRRLRAGDPVGFTRDERGRLLAVADDPRAASSPCPSASPTSPGTTAKTVRCTSSRTACAKTRAAPGASQAPRH